MKTSSKMADSVRIVIGYIDFYIACETVKLISFQVRYRKYLMEITPKLGKKIRTASRTKAIEIVLVRYR
jgi:hypothetical protein